MSMAEDFLKRHDGQKRPSSDARKDQYGGRQEDSSPAVPKRISVNNPSDNSDADSFIRRQITRSDTLTFTGSKDNRVPPPASHNNTPSGEEQIRQEKDLPSLSVSPTPSGQPEWKSGNDSRVISSFSSAPKNTAKNRGATAFFVIILVVLLVAVIYWIAEDSTPKKKPVFPDSSVRNSTVTYSNQTRSSQHYSPGGGQAVDGSWYGPTGTNGQPVFTGSNGLLYEAWQKWKNPPPFPANAHWTEQMNYNIYKVTAAAVLVKVYEEQMQNPQLDVPKETVLHLEACSKADGVALDRLNQTLDIQMILQQNEINRQRRLNNRNRHY